MLELYCDYYASLSDWSLDPVLRQSWAWGCFSEEVQVLYDRAFCLTGWSLSFCPGSTVLSSFVIILVLKRSEKLKAVSLCCLAIWAVSLPLLFL